MVAAYLRVSSRAQDAASQRSAIEKAAAARGETIDRWFHEKRSGKSLAREELARLREAIRAKQVTRLWVFRLDRLARSGIKDTFEVVEEARSNGCEILSVADGFSLEGPAAEVVLAVLAWASKMERLAINERISAARDRLEAEGRAWGRPSRMGPAELARLQELRAEGQSLRQIAVALKTPLATVARAARACRKDEPDSTLVS